MTTSRRPSGVGGIGCGCIVAAHGHYGQRTGVGSRMTCRSGGCVAGGMAGHSLMGARRRRVDGQGESRPM
jgi:hypothetical protein